MLIMGIAQVNRRSFTSKAGKAINMADLTFTFPAVNVISLFFVPGDAISQVPDGSSCVVSLVANIQPSRGVAGGGGGTGYTCTAARPLNGDEGKVAGLLTSLKALKGV